MRQTKKNISQTLLNKKVDEKIREKKLWHIVRTNENGRNVNRM